MDYHRLSAEEHRWIFDELIAPSYLSGIVSREDPRAVYVLGQPGAGKLMAARMVRRAMRPGTTRLVGDDFKVSHPDYFQLLRDDPRNAGPRSAPTTGPGSPGPSSTYGTGAATS
ncbi:zeta toxin family protein [Streptomyces nogalater]